MASDVGRRTQGIRPAEPLTTARIAAVGIRLVDARGVAGLTAPAVAAELGVTKTAIRWHVGDRHALSAVVGAAWMEQLVPPPDHESPFVWLATFARAYRDAAHRQPNVARLVAAGLSMGTDALTIPNAVIEQLERSALPREELVHAYNTVIGATIGFVDLELSRLNDRAVRSLEAVDAQRYPAIARNLDALADSAFAIRGGSSGVVRLDGSFDYLVGLLVAGLTARALATVSRPSTPVT